MTTVNKLFKTTVMRTLYVKVAGKQVFVNRYTRKVPGLKKVLNKAESIMLTKHTACERNKEYLKWFKVNYPSKARLKQEKKDSESFGHRPLISVLVPTYNTDIAHLKKCIESVKEQSYDNWQLCLADDASTDKKVVKTIKEYAKKDDRIEYVVRKKNGHICDSTNSALSLAKGEFVALLDHDDVLWPNALYEAVRLINDKPKTDFIYTDEDKISEHYNEHIDPFFKPSWSPEFLRSINYITHFAVMRKKLVDKVGGFRRGYEGAQDWDLFLRLSRQTNNIEHIPTILYSWRMSANSTAQQPSAKDYAYVNQKKALKDDIKARGLKADIEWQIPFSMWRVKYKVDKDPKVSIIIPTKNQYDYIGRCLKSVFEKTTYDNIELIVVDTGSNDPRVWDLYDMYKTKFKNMKLLEWTKDFNFATVCNYGAKHAEGEYYLFLNNDTEIITETWVNDMLGYAQQDEIGAVGCKLYYPDGRLQHGGIILGVGGQNETPGIAGHYFPAFSENPLQDPAQLTYVGGTRNFTAVTAACVLVSAGKFNAVKGFDKKYRIAFNDVDMCLKLFSKGWRSVYLPHVQLFHYESVSVGQPGSKARDLNEFANEIQMMLDSWGELIDNDPYYHPEFRKDLASARLLVDKD